MLHFNIINFPQKLFKTPNLNNNFEGESYFSISTLSFGALYILLFFLDYVLRYSICTKDEFLVNLVWLCFCCVCSWLRWVTRWAEYLYGIWVSQTQVRLASLLLCILAVYLLCARPALAVMAQSFSVSVMMEPFGVGTNSLAELIVLI